MSKIANRATQPRSIPHQAPPDSGGARLRFHDFEYESFPDGRCRSGVTLAGSEGTEFVGRSDGTQTLEGRLRSGARAALAAALSATEGRLHLDLLGVKALRAFDEWIVIVSVRGRTESDSYRLLGSFATSEDQAARGAALAVVDATNRILDRYQG